MAKNSNKVKKNTNKENNFKLLAENRYAKFQYAISETIEAGIELLGTEVKSIRNGKANLRDGYCSFRDGEILLLNVHISPHKNVGSFFNHDPLRNRKLLLHKKEIIKMKSNTEKTQIVFPTFSSENTFYTKFGEKPLLVLFVLCLGLNLFFIKSTN